LVTSFWITDTANASSGLIASAYRVVGQNSSPNLPPGISPSVTTTVSNIAFDWGSGSVLGAGTEDVIVIFSGYITSDIDASIQFTTDADDGTKLYLDDQLISDDWYDKGGGGSTSAPISFTAGVSKQITFWYYENGGGAKVFLYWNKNGSFEIVPSSAFSLSPAVPPTPPASLNPPTNLLASIDGATVTVSWSAPESTGTEIERYAIFWSYDNFQTGWAISSTTNQAIIYNIPDSQTVSIKVRSDNDSLSVYSEWSETVQIQSNTFFADEEARLAEEEAARVAAEEESARIAEEQRLAAEAAEAERLRLEEEARLAEQRRIEAEIEAIRQAAVAAEIERQRIEAEKRAEEEAARIKAEEEARIKAEEEERARLEEEARIKAEEEARLQAEEEARIKAEAEAKAKAEAEAKAKAEAEAKAKAEAEAKAKAEAEAKAKAEAEAKAKAEAEAQQKAEADAKKKLEEEMKKIKEQLEKERQNAEAKKPESIMSNALSDGVLSTQEKAAIGDALILEFSGSAGIPVSLILEFGLDYSDLPPDTPVQLENGVILTAEIADALEIFNNPMEIFSDPGKAVKAFLNVGADMSPEVREKAEDIVVVTVIVGQIIVAGAVLRR
jgi:hypothetical protein